MQVIDAPTTQQLLPYAALIPAMAKAFAQPDSHVTAPARMHYTVPEPFFDNSNPAPSSPRTLLIMPSWATDAGVVVKLVNVVPSNSQRSLASIQAQVLVADPTTGRWCAMIDGATLTARRTAAASALAASVLAPAHATTLLIMGTGRLAPELAAAHCHVRPSIKRILIWGRDNTKAKTCADQMQQQCAVMGQDITCEPISDRKTACAQADIISCCTLSDQPLVQGEWVTANTHIDLVGAFRPDLRESDGQLVAKSQVFVDTYAGANGEAGDLLQAQQEGHFHMENIRADLHQLATQYTHKHDPSKTYSTSDGITLFKSVGASLEDFVAARLLVNQLNYTQPVFTD